MRNTTGANIAVDFIELEQATAIANPDPTNYVVLTAFDQQASRRDLHRQHHADQRRASTFRRATIRYRRSSMSPQKSLQIVGAGPWFTRLIAPQGSENTETGFNISGAAATGSQFRNFGLFGNWTNRIDGQGQPFQLTNVSGLVLDNLWVQHFVVMVWGQNVDNSTFTNDRIERYLR